MGIEGNRRVIKEQKSPVDIQGHWAEKELALMIDYDVIEVDEDGKVYPDQEITRGEMIKMLMLTSNPEPYFTKMRAVYEKNEATFADVNHSSPYFAYVEAAVQQGLIDKSKQEFNPNEFVTREEIATLIVKALNLYELSKIEDMFTLDFNDRDQIQEKGVVSIVSHLGIMSGSNDFFHPTEKVTRAQAAKVYYEYLKQREELKR